MNGLILAQLQMMLMQQAGPTSLPLSHLSLKDIAGFLRKVEGFCLDDGLRPVLTYWSNFSQAEVILPSDEVRPGYLEEIKSHAHNFSIVKEARNQIPFEWCFLLESTKLSMVVYGQSTQDAPETSKLTCVGSMDAQLVRQSYDTVLAHIRLVDPAAAKQIDSARSSLRAYTAASMQLGGEEEDSVASNLLNRCRVAWQMGKLPNKLDALLGQIKPAAPVESAAVAPAESSLAEIPPVPPSAAAQSSPPAGSTPQAASVEGVIPLAAQEIIRSIFSKMRLTANVSDVLDLALEELVHAIMADRGIIWQVIDDHFVVTNEYSKGYSKDDEKCYLNRPLGAEESAEVFQEFLNRFPHDTGAGIISVPDIFQDAHWYKRAPMLASLIELGGVKSRLLAQLRCGNTILGFIELQQCREKRNWNNRDSQLLQSVSELLSVLVQQSFNQDKIRRSADSLNVLNQIARLFEESKGLNIKMNETVEKSVGLIKAYFQFEHAQLYLMDQRKGLLLPQIAGQPGAEEPIKVTDRDNHYVSVFNSGDVRFISYSQFYKRDPIFGVETALLVPVISEGQKLGVLSVWKKLPGAKKEIQIADRDIAQTIASQLSSSILANQAIAEVISKQRREEIILKVSTQVGHSPNDFNPVLQTLIEELKNYFDLAQCGISIYDEKRDDFVSPLTVSRDDFDVADASLSFSERVILYAQDQLKDRNRPLTFFTRTHIDKFVDDSEDDLPQAYEAVLLMPLFSGDKLKAVLCMVSDQWYEGQIDYLSHEDREMLQILTQHVALVVSNAEYYREKELQAVTDPMTGLHNRRYFHDRFSEEMDRGKRYGRSFSYVIIDLDYLKKINDNLGHNCGDAAIKHIADVLKKTVRDVDVVARFGGEEFVVLLPETDVQAGVIAAERLRAAIEERPVEGVGVVTASIGVSTYPNDSQDREHLAELADQALYLAKHRGRNRVCSVSLDLLPSLEEKGSEALEIQQELLKNKAAEIATINLDVIAEHGLLGIMGVLVKLIESRDGYTKDRAPRMANLTSKLAQALKLGQDHVTVISLASIMHNLGKVAMPEAILKKQGPLTEEERMVIQQGPQIGAKILQSAKQLHQVAAVIEACHENFDGSGYPKQLKGMEIPVEARIICIVDAYTAMTSDRPYRPALSHEDALTELEKDAGSRFDPDLVKAFIGVLGRTKAVSKTVKT